MESVLTVEDAPFGGNYYSDDYLTTDVKRGVTLNRSGTRLLALTNDFLIGLRTALNQECGEAADTVLKSCGRNWGTQFARKFERELSEFYHLPLREFPLMMFEACLIEAFSRHGWGSIAIDLSHQEKGLLLVELDNAVYADLLGKSEVPVDTLMGGLLAGLFSYLSGQDLDAVQSECKACGGKTSRFVLTLAPRLAGVNLAKKSHAEIVATLAVSAV